MPAQRGREPAWEHVLSDACVVVEVASAETLLAMRLHAAAVRGRREQQDIAVLLAATGITTVKQATACHAAYYPGAALPDRAVRVVRDALGSASGPTG